MKIQPTIAVPFLPIRIAGLLLAMLLVAASALRAQTKITYNDVAVIVNDNSDSSKAIGAYFAQKRNIPARNIIHISVPAQEQIDSLTFESLRRQVEKYLLANKMKDTINYLVTTKGMPLGCYRSGTNAGSVESDLMLILGADSTQIGKNSWFMQPYFGASEHFSHANYDFYLVTRLDGYTNADIFRMIDKSGPNTVVDQSKALFVMDEDPTPIDPQDNQNMEDANPILNDRGWKTDLDTGALYVTKQQNVIGYVSWGSNDDHSGAYSVHANPMNTWLPGSIGETYVSTGGRSFAPGTGYGQSLIADWIAEGISGIKGYVYEPYTVALAQVEILFDRYTDSTQDSAFNMAESYVMASQLASWMDVIVGDPKMSIITKLPQKPSPSVAPVQYVCLGGQIAVLGFDSIKSSHNWFKGTVNEIQAVGPPYDEHNPKWVGGGNQLLVAGTALGSQSYTYCDENLSGRSFAEVKVMTIVPPTGTIVLAHDSVNIGDDIHFSVGNTNATGFVWNFGDNVTDTNRNPTHHFLKLGTFNVSLLLFNGSCDTTVTKVVTVFPSGGVADPESFAHFLLSPNPAHSQFHFRFETAEPVRSVYRIVDVTGRTVLTGETPLGTTHEETIQLGHIAQGSYVFEAIAGGSAIREKIIVE